MTDSIVNLIHLDGMILQNSAENVSGKSVTSLLVQSFAILLQVVIGELADLSISAIYQHVKAVAGEPWS